MASNTELKKFAQAARRQLREQVAVRLEQVLGVDSVEVREKKSVVAQLRQQIAATSKAEVIDKVAYTWFNRFCALRYMDANHYTNVGVVSPAAGNTQPEILQEAKSAFIHEDLKNYVNSKDVFDLLSGSKPSANPQQEAYRLLLVAVCNSYFKIMPFLFEEISDYTELLIPLDLLSENSILFQLREVLTEEACQDVEVIGWLYQYYISERKDEVFEALKKNQKIEAKDIPAATQLFTPHWIVRYLVENSLGRLWLLNKPDSKLAEKIEYYIKPVDVEKDYLKVNSPEELKICDPACGSGHMLTYAFDLLYTIYEEEGYEPVSISSLILQKNLFGIEIDGRAGALAAFALFMKARSKDKRFFTRNIQPNVCVLENVSFSDQELKEYISAMGRDLFTEPLLETLKQFEQADNFGSLIRPILTNPEYVRQSLEQKNLAGNIFLFGIHERVLKVLKQSEYLSPLFHVVITNPPYMEISSANSELKDFAQDLYPNSKADLFAMFLERDFILSLPKGFIGMITMQSWMFLSSFTELREIILTTKRLLTMAHLGARAFDSISGEVVATTSFVIANSFQNNKYVDFINLTDGKSEKEKAVLLKDTISSKLEHRLFHKPLSDFEKIPGKPFSYWASILSIDNFVKGEPLQNIADPRKGMVTADNPRFIRYWFEVSMKNFGVNEKSREQAKTNGKKWFPYLKGGNFRRWYGNQEFVVNWKNDGYELRNMKEEGYKVGSTNHNLEYIFKPSVTWTKITTSKYSFRINHFGYLFDDASGLCPPKNNFDIYELLGFLNTPIVMQYLLILNPTMNLNPGDIAEIPYIKPPFNNIERIKKCEQLSRDDWDSFEYSFNFSESPLLFFRSEKQMLPFAYKELKQYWNKQTQELMQIEQKINNSYLNLYCLLNEITDEVPLHEVTLLRNVVYRYGARNNQQELEVFDKADTMKEFISYAVGCMFGRYSLDKPGLILADQGETLQDYLRQVPDPSFTPDEDNVLPILDGDWFQDDIKERFKKFLKVTFGEEHYEENLQFIEDAIGRDIRSYFLKEFYPYHLKMYKKRPIYWLFSSPKGTFNALIYMHRYNKDTVSIILNNYLREFKSKLEARKSFVEKISNSTSISPKEKTAAIKELETLKKQLDEITTYESKVLFPLAAKHIEIDLDDGVKANYPKFGEALVKIPGLVDKSE